MIRAAIICPDEELADLLQDALTPFHTRIGIARVLHQYPNEAKLPPFLKAAVPELIFLSAEKVEDAVDVAQRIKADAPGTAVIAFSRACDGPTMLRVLRAGIKDYLALPFESRALSDMLQRVETVLVVAPGSHGPNAPIFAFLPAKAGAGATTLAVNTSLALSRRPDVKTLLVDLDLNSGMVGFLLSIKPEYSVTDAADNAPDMDENLWSKIVTSIGNLDVLPAGTAKAGYRIHTSQVRRMLEFAQRNYHAICVDLSGMMEKYSVDLLQQMKQIFLICTPEVPSVHLTCAKLELLRTLELDDRVCILVNRFDKRQSSGALAKMESLFQKKVFLTAPNAYAEVQKALVDGRPIKSGSDLGLSIDKLAQMMLPNLAPAPAPEKPRSLLDSFVSRKPVASASKHISLLGSESVS
jgi:pilus assembly protein CpaE